MTTRRGLQNSIQWHGGGLRGRNDAKKWKRNGKIPSGKESKQVPEIPIISEPKLELSMSHFNRNKSNSEISDRHLHKSVQLVLHSLEREILGNAATNPPRSDELLVHPQEVTEGGGNSEIIQLMEPIIIQKSNKKMKEWHNKKREESKEESQVASTRRPQANQPPQEGKKNKKKNWKKPYSLRHRIPIIQKDYMENLFKMARTFI
ncbi:hypothetical protein O181_096788 [Austropuccinia psidii MF-1]|uniref:Uncharacterized protein n=1 Tax=Austropuccinia psidii MF-1 TaxID=1389203 RepID=A0A9Q3PCI5_9BASI|nr:hypothetical protein [Austropuccinia psidii MF-1]